MFGNFDTMGGTLSGSDIYGASSGGSQTAVAPLTEQASGGDPGAGGVGVAWSWVGFVALLVALRVLIELDGGGE